MKTYHGVRDEKGVAVFVEEDGVRRPLAPRLDLRIHAPTGVDWGYSGSGPAQLALALAAEVLADDDKALDLYQQLAFKLVGSLPHGGWTLSEERLRTVLAAIETAPGYSR